MTFRDLKAPKRAVCLSVKRKDLTAKTVQSTSLAFQSVHHIHGRHSLAFGVLGVGHSITDHILKENFENTSSLFVDQARDSLDTATASKTTNSWLGDGSHG